MGTKARPAQLRPHAGVRQFQAERARKAARGASDRAPGARRYAWPADRQAIIAATLAAGRGNRGRVSV